MSKVMNSKEFISKLKEIATLPTTYYSVAGGSWAKWNGKSWNFDCVILIKAILWGWNGNKNASHGGAKYASNGVFDDNANQILNRCSEVSTDFSNITPGELLWLDGHVGVYVGNGQVIECTAAWEGKVLYSTIDSKGRRIKNGKQVYTWKKHGKLNYIEYIKEEIIKKSTDELAQEVINGKWGNGADRKNKLTKAGYNYSEVQKKVNELVNKKSIDTIAKEVIQGKWGNGADRKNRLTKAGYNYKEVQNRVNQMLR